MDRISAGSNLYIDAQQDYWRLLANGEGEERLLVEARHGEPLRYIPSFGSQRRLPSSGLLSSKDVDRVVLGWSSRDASWHLGLMLEPMLAQSRGSRWCGLASWPDPDTSSYRDIAAQAGETLAQQINRPFVLIPPKPAEAPVGTSHNPAAIPMGQSASFPQAVPQAATVPLSQPVPLELPIRLEQWTLNRTEDPAVLQLTLTGAWGRSRLMRAGWYVLWAVVFVILSVTTLTSGIALPQPEFLPYAGLVAAVFLVLLSIATLIGAARRIKRIEIDGRQRVVRGMSGRKPRWTYTRDQLESVYASHIVTRVSRRKRARQIHHGEINLLARNGAFYHLLSHGQTVEKVTIPEDAPPEAFNNEDVTPLAAYNTYTHLQAAALIIAQMLDVTAVYDQRLK